MIGGRNLHSSVMGSFGSGTQGQRQPAVSSANRTSLHQIISSSRQTTPTVTAQVTGSHSQPKQAGTIIVAKRQLSKDKNANKNTEKTIQVQQNRLVGKSSDTGISAANAQQQVKQSTQNLQQLLGKGKDSIEKAAKKEDITSFSPIPKYFTPQPKQYQPKIITATIVPNYMPHAQQSAQIQQQQQQQQQGVKSPQQLQKQLITSQADSNNSPVTNQINNQNTINSNGIIKQDYQFQQGISAISSANVTSKNPYLKNNLQQQSNQIKGSTQNEQKNNNINDHPEGGGSSSLLFSKTKYIDLQQFGGNTKKSFESPQPKVAPQLQQQNQQIVLSVTSYVPSSASFSSKSSKVQNKAKIQQNSNSQEDPYSSKYSTAERESLQESNPIKDSQYCSFCQTQRPKYGFKELQNGSNAHCCQKCGFNFEKQRKQDHLIDVSHSPINLPTTIHNKLTPTADLKTLDLFPLRDQSNKGVGSEYLSLGIQQQQQSQGVFPKENNENNPKKPLNEPQQYEIQPKTPNNQIQNMYQPYSKEQEKGNQQITNSQQPTLENQFQNSKNQNPPQAPLQTQQFQTPQYQIPQLPADGKYQQSFSPLPNTEFTPPLQQISNAPVKPNQPTSQFTQQSIEAYQLGDWEEGVKRRKLCVFSERVQNAKNEFENVLREFNENSSQTMSEYHQNIQFLETSENILRNSMNEVTSNLKSILLETFNQSLSRCKTGQFEVQQIITYLNSTENDLMSNIEGIVKDMDISSLDDIINQYEQVITHYERILQENISKITYTSYQSDHLQAKSSQIYALAKHLQSQFQEIIALQAYSANILGQRQNQLKNMNDSNSKQVWNSSQFGQINDKITGNITQLPRSLLQDTGEFKPSNFEVVEQNQQQNLPKSIYVSFENKDVFTNAVSNQSLKEALPGQQLQQKNPEDNRLYPVGQLINFQRQDSYPQPQSPSFQSPFLGAQQPSKDKNEELNQMTQNDQKQGNFNFNDQNTQINQIANDFNNNKSNNLSQTPSNNNKQISNTIGKPIVNLNLVSSPPKINNQLSNPSHFTNILPLSPSDKNHSYKFSGGSTSGINPSSTTTANTLTEPTGSLAQTSTSSRAQSEKIKGISDLYDHQAEEAKANRRMLSNQEQQRSIDMPLSTSLWNSAEHRSNIKFPEDDSFVDKQSGQSKKIINNPSSTTAAGVISSQLTQNYQGVPVQQTPVFSHEDFEKTQDSNNTNCLPLAKRQHKYNELLQKIQVNQSHTEKLYSDVLHGSGAAFKFSLLEDGIPLRSSAQCVSLTNNNNNKN